MVGGSGTAVFEQFDLVEVPTFVEYLMGGWQISFAVAIDFTASNQPQNNPNSLHYMGAQNQYVQAINQVGTIIEPYDFDK